MMLYKADWRKKPPECWRKLLRVPRSSQKEERMKVLKRNLSLTQEVKSTRKKARSCRGHTRTSLTGYRRKRRKLKKRTAFRRKKRLRWR